MDSTNTRPRWWQVYLSFPLLIVLFIADSRLRISTRGHQAVQIGIIVMIYGLIQLWVKANAGALSGMGQQADGRTVRVIRIPIAYDSERDNQRRFALQISESKIKDLRTDTVNLNHIDANSSSFREIHQN